MIHFEKASLRELQAVTPLVFMSWQNPFRLPCSSFPRKHEDDSKLHETICHLRNMSAERMSVRYIRGLWRPWRESRPPKTPYSGVSIVSFRDGLCAQ